MADVDTSVVVGCERCGSPSPVVEVDEHGRVFYGLDCPRCGLHVPHGVVSELPSSPERSERVHEGRA
jgi:hypothetical protein